MPQGFADQVKAFTDKLKARQLACFQESVQRTVEIIQTPVGAGGNLPVDTGFLRASLGAVLGEGDIPAMPKPASGGSYRYSPSPVGVVLAGAKLGDVVRVGYGANYAIHVEYGTSNHPARGFVRLGLQRWPQTVEAVAREIAAKTNVTNRRAG